MPSLPHWWRQKRPNKDLDYKKELAELRERTPIPTIWLFGKTGSGKSSIVHHLTGAEDATIGEGFRPHTKATNCYDFPNADEPLLRFLDTRGLGEPTYDPREDMVACDNLAQVMIITVRVGDHSLEKLMEPLRAIRKINPSRPIILAVTCLHTAPDSMGISEGNDPFEEEHWPRVPASLRRLVEEKKRQFAGLYDDLVPIDLTRVEDGFAKSDFGAQRLKKSILHALPQAYRQSLIALDKSSERKETARQRRARWQVLASSSLAATAGAVPVPWVDIPLVLGIQGHMAYKIADIYEQEITPENWAILSGAAGTRIAMSLGIRALLKLVPFVGMAAGAASSFAFTYALGMSWDWYFTSLRHGHVPSADKLKEVFAEQLKHGQDLWGLSKQ